MHNPKNIGRVELATISFGQSFQITPVQLATTVSSIINGGNRVTPLISGLMSRMKKGKKVKTFKYETTEGIVSEKTSETVRMLLEKVVSEGTGKKCRDQRCFYRRKDSDFPDTAKKCK